MWLFIWGFSAGVVTKPDLVDRGAEQELIEVVTNARYHLRRGYTMVKCRGQQAITKKQTLREALDNEEDFFQNHPQLRFPKLINVNYQRYQWLLLWFETYLSHDQQFDSTHLKRLAVLWFHIVETLSKKHLIRNIGSLKIICIWGFQDYLTVIISDY